MGFGKAEPPAMRRRWCEDPAGRRQWDGGGGTENTSVRGGQSWGAAGPPTWIGNLGLAY